MVSVLTLDRRFVVFYSISVLILLASWVVWSHQQDGLSDLGIDLVKVEIPGEDVLSNINQSEQKEILPFRIMKHEVTQGLWKKVMGYNPSFFQECGLDCPVESISWEEIQVFVFRLNKLTGMTFKVPTETEWLIAAGAGRDKFVRWNHLENCTHLIVDGEPDMCGKQEAYFQQALKSPVSVFASNEDSSGIMGIQGNVQEAVDTTFYYDALPSDPYLAIGYERTALGGDFRNLIFMTLLSNREPFSESKYRGLRLVVVE
jgi:formylglycine-generating enzyme required for sulfatase activity